MHELQPPQVKRLNTDLDVLGLFERADEENVIDLYVVSSIEECTHEVSHEVTQEVTHELTLQVTQAASGDDDYYSYESSQSDDDYDVEDEEDEIMSTNLDDPDMSIGTKFANIEVFKLALSQYAVMNEFRVKYVKSEPKRVTVQCYEHDCKWRLHASRVRDEETFQIRTLQEQHTCVSMNRNSNTMATQFWIAEKCTPWLRNEGDLSVKEIARRLNSTYHLQLPYQRIYRGKKVAFEALHGTWVEMYGRVADLRAELLARNEGSIVKIDVEEDHTFRRIFICFAACSQGFLLGCRHLIGLDGCHLKGTFRGALLAATGVDGENSLFPIAFAIVEGENGQSWLWFLECLREAIGYPEDLSFISDQVKGLDTALPFVFPQVEHRICLRHFHRNFKKKFSGDDMKNMLWNAARSYNEFAFEAAMQQIKKKVPAAYVALTSRDMRGMKWSRSQFNPHCKCKNLTNNMSESFNAYIGDARWRPILDCIDVIRVKIMHTMQVRRNRAARWNDTLVPTARKHVVAMTRGLGGYHVQRSDVHTAEVSSPTDRAVVDLDAKTCSCMVWQKTGLPCVHACAFLGTMRVRNWDEYVDKCYSVEAYKMAYALAIGPMPDKSQWTRLGFQLFPPKVRRPPGRPRNNRIRDPDETKKITRVHKCGRCGEAGHHSNSCKNLVNTNIASGSTERRPAGRPKKGRQQYPTAPLPTQTSQDASSSGAVPSTQTSQVHSESVEGQQESRGRGRGWGLNQIWRL